MSQRMTPEQRREIRDLFFAEDYTTNAITDAFAGANRSDVLLIKALLDTMAERMRERTHANANALNVCIKVLVSRLGGTP